MTVLERGATVPLLGKHLWKPQDALAAGRQAFRGARPAAAASLVGLSAASGRAHPLCCHLSHRAHSARGLRSWKAFAALSGVKCNLPEIKSNYGIS